jgi:hypothetical protein
MDILTVPLPLSGKILISIQKDLSKSKRLIFKASL